MKQIIPVISLLAMLTSCGKKEDAADAYGNFEANETMVASQASGPLVVFNIDEGQALKAGQLVGLVDTTPLDLKRKQLIAQREAIAAKNPTITGQIAVLNQQKANVLIEQQRLQKMFEEGAATQKQIDDVNGQLEVIEKQIKSVETQNSGITAEMKSVDAQIAQVNDQISRSYIVNPIDGTVLTKYAEQTEIAAPGKNLYKVGDLGRMEIRAYLSGNQLSSVKIGQRTKVKFDTEGGQFGEREGTIVWISSSAEFTPKIVQTKEERTSLVYAIKVEVENKDGQIKIGMPGEVFLSPQTTSMQTRK